MARVDRGPRPSYRAVTAGWSSSSPAGRAGFLSPGVAPTADGRLQLFVANGQLWRLEQTAWSGNWSGWQPHGAPPGEFVIGPVEAAGAQTAGSRSSWSTPAAPCGTSTRRRSTARGRTGPPSAHWVAGWPTVRLSAEVPTAGELFVRGNDCGLWHRWQTRVSAAPSWSNWVAEGTAGGGLLDHPVIGSSAGPRTVNRRNPTAYTEARLRCLMCPV